MKAGKTNTLAFAELLRENGSISFDILLLFDELHMQKLKAFIGAKYSKQFER